MKNITDNYFCELNNEELLELDGGIAFVPAVILVAKIVGGCAVTGFVAGCIYEVVLG